MGNEFLGVLLGKLVKLKYIYLMQGHWMYFPMTIFFIYQQ